VRPIGQIFAELIFCVPYVHIRCDNAALVHNFFP